MEGIAVAGDAVVVVVVVVVAGAMKGMVEDIVENVVVVVGVEARVNVEGAIGSATSLKGVVEQGR